MWFMYAISWIGFLTQLIVITFSIAAGLFYLAELVEEYATVSGKIIRYLNYAVILTLFGHLFFEELPLSLIVCCLVSHILYHLVLQTFPYIELTSPWFILSVVLIVIDHFLAFSHFSEVHYPFPEILGFFTIDLWLIPLALFVSLSACDNVLPTSIVSESRQDNDSDIVTSYFKRKGKKYGLLYFLKSAQDSILPQRVKKSF